MHRGSHAHAGEHQEPDDGGGECCGELVEYVDDGFFSFSHTDPIVLSRILTQKYNQLEQWMNNNRLVIKPNKTHMMVLGTRKKQEVNMMAGEHMMKPTDTEKLLGGHIHQTPVSQVEAAYFLKLIITNEATHEQNEWTNKNNR